MKYSFFYSAGTAGYVRGEQMADWLKGKKNPKTGFEGDICIYVKVLPPSPCPLRSYLDVDDGIKAVKYLRHDPNMKIIATSQTAKEFLKKTLGKRDISVIPHAHCNWENQLRPVREVKTVGIIGSITSFQSPIDQFRAKLKKIGLNLLYKPNYWDTYKSTPGKPGRLKVVDFYKQIDIQVVWRPKMFAAPLKNPNKLVNAGSFGIPTVAYPEENFLNEWSGRFISAKSIDYMVAVCKVLQQNLGYYQHFSEIALIKASECDVDKIVKLYKDL